MMARPQVLAPRLLDAFRRYPGVTLSRGWLAVHVWDGGVSPSSRAIDVAVGELRRGLGGGEKIEAVPGCGYRYLEK